MVEKALRASGVPAGKLLRMIEGLTTLETAAALGISAKAAAAASIVTKATPGVANHGEMMIRKFAAASPDNGRIMRLQLRKPLGAGTYELHWQAEQGRAQQRA